MIKAEILADSKDPRGNRITTMKLTYPRIIHSEFMTHRMFSRNAASSRAIPLLKMVKRVRENPFIPIAFQKHHKGMQGIDYLQGEEAQNAKDAWLDAKDNALKKAGNLWAAGVTKQLCNRLLEPFMWYQCIVTATEFENFFKLRCPQYEDTNDKIFRSKKDFMKEWEGMDFSQYSDTTWLLNNKSQAEIHIQALAEAMWDSMNESTPKELKEGEWHIPFGDNMDETELFKIANAITKKERPDLYPHSTLSKELTQIRIATARCARVSYQTLGDNPKIDYEKDIKLHDRLLAMQHMSPFEHCARVMTNKEYDLYDKGLGENPYGQGYLTEKGWCRNFRGFEQYRNIVES